MLENFLVKTYFLKSESFADYCSGNNRTKRRIIAHTLNLILMFLFLEYSLIAMINKPYIRSLFSDPGLLPVPDSPGLSRFGAYCPGGRRDPHRDIERPGLWVFKKERKNVRKNWIKVFLRTWVFPIVNNGVQVIITGIPASDNLFTNLDLIRRTNKFINKVKPQLKSRKTSKGRPLYIFLSRTESSKRW